MSSTYTPEVIVQKASILVDAPEPYARKVALLQRYGYANQIWVGVDDIPELIENLKKAYEDLKNEARQEG